MRATAKIIRYTHKVLSDGSSPIILQIIYNRSIKRISLGLKCRAEEWDSGERRFTKKPLKDKNNLILQIEARADTIIDSFQKDGKEFTFDQFEQAFRKKTKPTNVLEFFDTLIQDMKETGREGNKNIYQDTKNAIARFSENKRLMFADIDYSFLKKLEKYLFGTGCTNGGISVYMRTIRAVFNEAIRQNIASPTLYPFSNRINKNGYSIASLKAEVNPRAITLADMEKFKAFDLEKYPEFSLAFRYFLFSYYSRGMNFTDMAFLKWSDLYNDRINYVREKTGGFFSVKISGPLQEILTYFKGQNETYVFPILRDIHKTPGQKKNRIKKCLKKYNQDLKEITKVLKIDVPITSYTARHTFATTLKRKGVDISVISEGLGHRDVLTTRHYLKQFDNEVLDEADEVL